MAGHGSLLLKRLLLCTVFLFLIVSRCVDAAPVAVVSEEVRQERLERAAVFGEHHQQWIERFLADNPTRETGGIVFLGDSITEHFPIAEAFPHDDVINRGIGGDMVGYVRSRLDTSVADLAPSKIYVMIGINDLWSGIHTAATLLPEYAALVEAVCEAAPKASLHLQSTLPTMGRGDAMNEEVRRFNEGIAALAREFGAEYVDLWPTMATETGSLRPEFTSDGVHLTLPGYLAWLNMVLTSEAEYIRAVRNLAPRWRTGFQGDWPIKAISPTGEWLFQGGRGTDELIVYTPQYGHPTTMTNEWGSEVTVVDGIVLAAPRGNNSPIPAEGMVISGHGIAANWISANLSTGTRVQMTDERISVTPVISEDLLFECWHAIAALDARDAGDADWAAIEGLLRDVRQLGNMHEGVERGSKRGEILNVLRTLNPDRYR